MTGEWALIEWLWDSLRLGILFLALAVERSLTYLLYAWVFLLPRSVDAWLRRSCRWVSNFSVGLDAEFHLKSTEPGALASNSPRSEIENDSIEDWRQRLFMNTFELCASMGIQAVSYTTDTGDGFQLTLHRLIGNEGREPVLLMHGLCMSSECFVFDPDVSLARRLWKEGYDVWMGNNRGNKYSWYNKYYERHQREYWQWDLDALARHDVPAMFNKIISVTGMERFSFIGFSNGCGQLFAAIHHDPNLTSQIRLAILLAPAIRIRSLSPRKGIILPLVLGDGTDIFYRWAFGYRAFVPSADRWKRILTPQVFASVIGVLIKAIFGWEFQEYDVPYGRKVNFHNHLYSSTSTMLVHHWLQIISGREFRRYAPSSAKFCGDIIFERYDTEGMSRMDMTAFVGSEDLLTDAQWMRTTMSNCTLFEVKDYQHLDFICRSSLRDKVYPKILEVLAN